VGAAQREVAMVLADVNLGDLIWTTIVIFFLIMFIWVFIMILSDLFRDHEMSGWGKAAWVIALIIFPLLGSLVYLIARGQGMAERSAAQQQQARADLDSYIRSTASSGGTADELARLAELRSNGTISDAEFETAKAKVLGTGTTATTGTGTDTAP
jgi:Phospholipase_D-nuclease N-terminal/Short C-terminal domain